MSVQHTHIKKGYICHVKMWYLTDLPFKLNSHGGHISIHYGFVRLITALKGCHLGLKVLLDLLVKCLQSICLTAVQSNHIFSLYTTLRRLTDNIPFCSWFIQEKVFRKHNSCTLSQHWSVQPAPASPAEIPPCLSASGTDSTSCWKHGCHNVLPGTRKPKSSNLRHIVSIDWNVEYISIIKLHWQAELS